MLRTLALFSALLTVPFLAACGARPAGDASRQDAIDAAGARPEEGSMSEGDSSAAGAPGERTAGDAKASAVKWTQKDEAYWREKLTPEEYRVLRKKGTEPAFSGKYWDTKTAGVYHCAACGMPLFVSDAKFDSGCGWPSFFEPLDGARITETRDTSHGMVRTEVTCSRCGGHLGHVFHDGPAPTGLRYCINSVSIDLNAGEKAEAKGGKQAQTNEKQAANPESPAPSEEEK